MNTYLGNLIRTCATTAAIAACAPDDFAPPASLPPSAVEVVSGALRRDHLPTYAGPAADIAKSGKPMTEQVTIPATGGDPATQCSDCSLTRGTESQTQAQTPLGSLGAYSPPRYGSLPQNDALTLAYNALLPKANEHLSSNASADNVEATLEDIHDVLEATVGLMPDAVVHDPVIQKSTWARAFRPTFGRHMSKRLAVTGTTNYPNPKLLGELTDRGANSYCAMRDAAEQQQLTGKTRLLDEELGDAGWWHIGVTKGDLTLAKTGPEMKHTSLDGAQAFVIPMVIGAKVAPLTGPLVPDLGTFEHPLVWVSADAEAITREDYGPLQGLFGSNSNDYRKEYRNITHTDVFAGNAYTGHIGVEDITLANFGLFKLNIGLDIDVAVGQLNQPNETAGAPFVGGWSYYDRLSAANHVQGPWPSPRSDGLDVSSYGTAAASDAPFGALGCGELDDLNPSFTSLAKGECEVAPFSGEFPNATAAPGWAVKLEPANAARLREDDDRSVVLSDSAAMKVTLGGDIGFDFGIAALLAKPRMSLELKTQLDTVLREQLSEADSDHLAPPRLGTSEKTLQTNFVATAIPSNTLKFEPLTIDLQLTLQLPPPIGDVTWEERIFELDGISGGLGDEGPRDETTRLRVGEFSAARAANANAMPLFSHLPGALTKFASRNESVAQCLADPREVGSDPAPEPTLPGEPEKQLNVCYAGIDVDKFNYYIDHYALMPVPMIQSAVPALPANICDPGATESFATIFGDPDQAQCVRYTLQYLCGELDGSQDQSAMGFLDDGPQRVVSHIAKNEAASLSDEMWTSCLGAFATSDFGQPEADAAASSVMAQFFVHSFVHVRTCEPDGTLTGQPDAVPCRPDEVTDECWSLTPCYYDEETETCEPVCDDTSGSCVPYVPTFGTH